MREVAKLAGVSRMTVSRALNQPEKVKEALRTRVQEAVAELGYVHNHLARSLSSSRSTVIGLILPSLENSIFSQTVKGISDVLRPAGFQLMLAESSDDPEEEERVIAAFLAQRVSGLVLHSTRHSAAAIKMLRGAAIPVVENGDMPADPVDMVVSYSNRGAAKAMTLHLARLGYSRIAFAGLVRNPRASERQVGFREAIEEAGLPFDPRAMVGVSRGFVGGAEAISYIEQSRPDTDALFCAGDVLAAGALFDCDRRGWAVPGRLALASFDDLDLMRFVNPAITALRLPRYEIGRRSAEMLLARLLGRELPLRSVDLGFEILHRASA
ncbi:LacI family transcriptional regulator [Sphingomonas panacis]|uniref:LacI family transcriptional regulator n=1 Tax=Sphingomonas panacis TaxID=1560345 RepID=A0A1B3Z643_9SPHN|nr:LacI family DNA-binding transcriptional regulator [Sphingomonas panacis]AOH82897.1 LacI family transcriptional regulator [Sphingomonas panacis]